MAREPKSGEKPIEQYDHKGKKRVNNPPVGLVSPELDREKGVKAYAYDPHRLFACPRVDSSTDQGILKNRFSGIKGEEMPNGKG